jgi:hypothetical protein
MRLPRHQMTLRPSAEGDLRGRLQECGPAWVRAVQVLHTDGDSQQASDAQDAHAAALKRLPPREERCWESASTKMDY